MSSLRNSKQLFKIPAASNGDVRSPSLKTKELPILKASKANHCDTLKYLDFRNQCEAGTVNANLFMAQQANARNFLVLLLKNNEAYKTYEAYLSVLALEPNMLQSVSVSKLGKLIVRAADKPPSVKFLDLTTINSYIRIVAVLSLALSADEDGRAALLNILHDAVVPPKK